MVSKLFWSLKVELNIKILVQMYMANEKLKSKRENKKISL
jgi:hypothetical protein